MNVFTLMINDRYGPETHVLCSRPAAMAKLAEYCGQNWERAAGFLDEPDDDEFAKLTDEQIVGLYEEHTGDDEFEYEIEAHALVLEPPASPKAAAMAAVEALRFARDCLKAAAAPRALNRVRATLKSVEGAVRAVGYRTNREANTNG